jgi:hypothetical protein
MKKTTQFESNGRRMKQYDSTTRLLVLVADRERECPMMHIQSGVSYLFLNRSGVRSAGRLKSFDWKEDRLTIEQGQSARPGFPPRRLRTSRVSDSVVSDGSGSTRESPDNLRGGCYAVFTSAWLAAAAPTKWTLRQAASVPEERLIMQAQRMRLAVSQGETRSRQRT